jgi:hypothetical protein
MIEAFVLEGCILPGAQQLASEMDPLELVVVAWQQQ